MARLSEARHFYLNKMKFRLFFLAFIALFVASCNNSPKVMTYQDAEREFIASLTENDTLSVLSATGSFMESLKAGQIDDAILRLTMVENDVLYMLGDESLNELRNRFTNFPVQDYQLIRYSFSTQGINDVVYRYSFDGPLTKAAGMKLVFNPIKVGDSWYLSLKDGYQSSKDQSADKQTHPQAPAPYPIKLNSKQFN